MISLLNALGRTQVLAKGAIRVHLLLELDAELLADRLELLEVLVVLAAVLDLGGDA